MRTRTPFAVMIVAVTGLVACPGVSGTHLRGTMTLDARTTISDRFMSEMGNLGIAYDYDPSEPAVDLRGMADLVVEGARVDLTQAADELVFTVEVVAVLQGDGSAVGHDVRFAEGFNPAERNLRRRRRRVHPTRDIEVCPSW